MRGTKGVLLAMVLGCLAAMPATAAAPPQDECCRVGNPVKDILVTVQETSTGSLRFGEGVNSDTGLTGSIVINERNFDILRPPTIDDILNGKTWRGAGQEMHIEAVPGTLFQGPKFRLPKDPQFDF